MSLAKGFAERKIEKVAECLKELKAFKDMDLVNTYVWEGHQGWGPGVMTIWHCDTQQVLQNVFMFDR
jgi:hypothetical protein